MAESGPEQMESRLQTIVEAYQFVRANRPDPSSPDYEGWAMAIDIIEREAERYGAKEKTFLRAELEIARKLGGKDAVLKEWQEFILNDDEYPISQEELEAIAKEYE